MEARSHRVPARIVPPPFAPVHLNVVIESQEELDCLNSVLMRPEQVAERLHELLGRATKDGVFAVLSALNVAVPA